jgi:hypothetical protein
MCSLALHAACTASIMATLALTTGSSAQPRKSSLVHSGTPPWVGAATDCTIRELAWRFGKTLQPSRGEFRSLFDALQLDLCGIAPPPHVHEWVPAPSHAVPLADAAVFEVDPATGDDRIAGTSREHTRVLRRNSNITEKMSPTSTWPRQRLPAFRTVAAAVAASRRYRRDVTAREAAAAAVHIVLAGGTHHLDSTLHLGPEDSWLTLRNRDGEAAVLSGGVPLTTRWVPSARCTGCWEASLVGQNVSMGGVTGLRRNGVREIRARYPNFDPEMDSTFNGTRHFHDGQDGWITAPTMWIAAGPGMNGVAPWPPINSPATTYIIRDTDWPGVDWPMNITTNGTADPDSDTGCGEWGEFVLGVGGTCADRYPPLGYFCAPDNPRNISTPNHPSGLVANASQLPNLPYANATGAVIHAWRPAHWYTNIFEVGDSNLSADNNSSTTFMFSRGGTQGGEGANEGESWYIENVLEELDMGREWFFDTATTTLVYKPNASDTDVATGAPTGDFVATKLKVLINISGTKASPAHHVAITGITLRDTVETYFEPHGLPSGGDWALQRQGAVTIVGSENVIVDNCLFTRLDGNGIFIGGYHRNLSLTNNEFSFIGASAMAAWGDTSSALNANGTLTVPGEHKVGPDGRGGEQPRGTVVHGNIGRELGLWQKQVRDL